MLTHFEILKCCMCQHVSIDFISCIWKWFVYFLSNFPHLQSNNIVINIVTTFFPKIATKYLIDSNAYTSKKKKIGKTENNPPTVPGKVGYQKINNFLEDSLEAVEVVWGWPQISRIGDKDSNFDIGNNLTLVKKNYLYLCSSAVNSNLCIFSL